MRVAPLIPLVFLGGILYHGTKGIRGKLSLLMGIGERVHAQKDLKAIRTIIEKKSGALGELSAMDESAQREWVRTSVRDPTYKRSDMSLDIWGTPIRMKLVNIRFILSSAGPDKSFDNSDDLKEVMIFIDM